MKTGPDFVAHVIPAFRRQRQADLCEFKANLVYIENFRTVRATQNDPVSKKKGLQRYYFRLKLVCSPIIMKCSLSYGIPVAQ